MSRALMRAVTLAVALCAAATLLALAGTAVAAAETFGGLGRIAPTIQGSQELESGKISLEKGKIDMAIEPSTGAMYIASQAEKEPKPGNFEEFAIVQRYSKSGAFEGQTEFPIGKLDNIHGLAIDVAEHKLYLATEAEVGATGKFKVGDVWTMSIAGGAPSEPKTLVTKLGEKGFFDPAGIAVDPEHDVLVLGYQETSKVFFAALQVVHKAGTLGPRYIDKSGCLTGQMEEAENACKQVKETEDTLADLVVTPGGHVLVSDDHETLWEIPDPEPARGELTVEVTPRNVFAFDEGSYPAYIGLEGQAEGQGEMATYAPGAVSGEGTLYESGEVGSSLTGHQQPPALIAFHVSETGGKVPELQELGWTGGQEIGTKNPKCLIPLPGGLVGTSNVLLGATASGSVITFDVNVPEEGKEEPRFEEFGAGAGAEACGTVSLTSPAIEFGEAKEAKEAPVGKPVKLTSKLQGANALSATWTIVAPGGAKEELHSTFSTPEQHLTPTVEHTFAKPGEYELIETVQTDNLGAPVKVERRKVIVGGLPVKFEAVAGGLRAEVPITFKTAKIKDTNEPEPKLKLTWNFGDGTAPVVHEVKGAEVTASETHTFAKPGTYKVTLVVQDAVGAEGKAEIAEVKVGESAGEEAAKRKLEEEAATKQQEQEAMAAKHKQEEEAAAKRKHEEELAVLNSKTKHDPAASVASASVSVTSNGAASVTITCPPDEESMCEGTVTLRTLTAVAAKKSKKAILTLASGSFSVAGGGRKVVVLHLSGKARTLLARSRTLRALAIVAAHDNAGLAKRTESRVTLHLVAKKKHH